jgi:uncharacterized membrane protein
VADRHPNTRLEAFCDGVFAIALTLLIIDIKVPAADAIHSTHDLWLALGALGPRIFAFVLSFVVILITWVNHHRFVGMLDKSSGPFVYANGFLMLTVVAMPFPTALVGEYLLTDHAAPAVIIYNGLTAVQALSWILVTGAALSLARDENAVARVREGHRNGYFACIAYSLLAIIAIWFPFAIAIVTALFWAYWLAFSIKGD